MKCIYASIEVKGIIYSTRLYITAVAVNVMAIDTTTA